MANTKITLGNIADDAVGLDQLNISNSPSDGQALTYDGNSTNLQWATISGGVSGISSSADATAITIDSSENVGIGRTPNANGILQLNVASGNNCNITFSENTTEKFLIGSVTSSNAFRIYDLANSAERMRITSAGNVAIGTSSANAYSNVTTLTVNGSTQGRIDLEYGGTHGASLLALSGETQLKAVGSSQVMTFEVNNAERMRVNSNGNLMVGTTTNPLTNSEAKINIVTTTGEDGINIKHAQPGYNTINIYQTGSTTFNAIKFYKGGTQAAVGQIQCTTSATSYQSGSDYRLKENIIDLTDAIDRVKQLQPKRFNFIADETDELVDGFLAHEAQTVVPEAVSGSHNEVDEDHNPIYQCIDLAKLVPVLTGALKEAITKIETLEARIETLESN